MEMQSQKLERLLTTKGADWANVPTTGSIPGITIPAGHRSILVERATGCIILSDEGKPFTRPDTVTFTRAIRIDASWYRKEVFDFEDHVTYMYLDCKGLVTVGLGHRIPNAEAAMAMEFWDRKTGEKAHDLHVKNSYNLVLDSGLRCKHHSIFEDMTQIDLDLDTIEILFDDDVMQFIHQLKHKFPDFETYPAFGDCILNESPATAIETR